MISSNAWNLARARGRCLIRKLRPVIRANPALMLFGLLVPVGSVSGLTWISFRNGESLASAADSEMAESLLFTVAIIFAILGFTIQHMSDPSGALDDQVRSAPVTRFELFFGVAGIPFLTACLGFLVLSSLPFTALIYWSDAPWYAICYLFVYEAGIFFMAGAVGEIFARLTMRQYKPLLLLALLVTTWICAAALVGNVAWSGLAKPLGSLVFGLGLEAPFYFTLGSGLLFVVAVSSWCILGFVPRPQEQQLPSRIGERFEFPNSALGIVTLNGLKRMVRDRTLQRHVLFLAVAGMVASMLATAFLDHIATIILSMMLLLVMIGAAVLPLTAPGINRGSSWFWRSTPLPISHYVFGTLVAGFAGGAAALIVGGATIVWALFLGGDTSNVGMLLAVGVILLLLASGVGFIMPASLNNNAEQIFSFAAFGASVVGAFAAIYLIVPRVVPTGVSDSIVGVGIVFIVGGASVLAALLAERMRRKLE